MVADVCKKPNMKRVWNICDDLVVCLDDFNGYVGWHIDRFDCVHLWRGVGRKI